MKTLLSLILFGLFPYIIEAQLTVSPDHNFKCPIVKVATKHVKFVRFYVQNYTQYTKTADSLDLGMVFRPNDTGVINQSSIEIIEEKSGQPFSGVVLPSGDMRWYSGYADFNPTSTPVQVTFTMSVTGFDSEHYQRFKTDTVTLLTDSVAAAISGIAPENRIGNDITIYPNPAHGFINIALDGITNIRLCDILGNVVVQQVPTNTNTAVNISALKPGIYFLTVSKGQGIFSQKIIKE